MTTDSAFDLIKETWFTVRDGFGDTYAAATTEEQRKVLVADRDGARDAFYLAMGKLIDETDGYVQKTKTELIKANSKMKSSLESLKSIVKTLGAISEAVKLSAALASMVVV